MTRRQEARGQSSLKHESQVRSWDDQFQEPNSTVEIPTRHKVELVLREPIRQPSSHSIACLVVVGLLSPLAVRTPENQLG